MDTFPLSAAGEKKLWIAFPRGNVTVMKVPGAFYERENQLRLRSRSIYEPGKLIMDIQYFIFQQGL